MIPRRVLVLAWLLLSFLATSNGSCQTSGTQLREKLVGQPLYLRGGWRENTLAFDGAGKPRSSASPGALTLSGVNVTDVSLRGKRLTISGERVALVADANGKLQRQTPSSSTVIFGSLMPKDKRVFKAKEEMKITVEADGQGSFDAALKVIFANGLADLATSVPAYWSCYAEGYFKEERSVSDARQIVEACVQRESASQVKAGEPVEGQFVAPRMTSSVPPSFPPEAAELGVRGTSEVQCMVTQKGVCDGYQVVQALGAGVDEAMLSYLYQARFQPATKNGVVVSADYEGTFRFESR
jgi:TonB family protein